MTQIIYNALVRADELLDSISVKGNDVYSLAETRRLLKTIFDELNKPPESEEAKGEND